MKEARYWKCVVGVGVLVKYPENIWYYLIPCYEGPTTGIHSQSKMEFVAVHRQLFYDFLHVRCNLCFDTSKTESDLIQCVTRPSLHMKLFNKIQNLSATTATVTDTVFGQVRFQGLGRLKDAK